MLSVSGERRSVGKRSVFPKWRQRMGQHGNLRDVARRRGDGGVGCVTNMFLIHLLWTIAFQIVLCNCLLAVGALARLVLHLTSHYCQNGEGHLNVVISCLLAAVSMHATDDHREELDSHNWPAYDSNNTTCYNVKGTKTPNACQSNRSTTGY